MTFSEIMAAKLKAARNNAQVSAVDAGKAVGRSDKTIYAWENNKSEPSAEQLIELCRLYDVDITFFYQDNSNNDSNAVFLSRDESELIDVYRRMSEKKRMALLSVAKALVSND